MPFEVECLGERLVVRLLSGGGQCLLLREERVVTDIREALQGVNLTRQEAEVLACVIAEFKADSAQKAAAAATKAKTLCSESRALNIVAKVLGRDFFVVGCSPLRLLGGPFVSP